MPHTAPSLARRIDRLARHAHRFHRFAHHPLCAAYAPELIPLGRRARLCRGCALAGVGFCAGLAVGTLAGAPASFLEGTALLLGAWGALGFAAAALLRRRRPSKLLTRGLPALITGAVLGRAIHSGPGEWLVIGVAMAVPAVGFLVAYRRRGPDRTPCATCWERSNTKVCSGFLPIVRRERAFRRLSARWLSLAARRHPLPASSARIAR